MDAAKARAKKAAAADAEKQRAAETQLRQAQWEFDDAYNECKTALERVVSEQEKAQHQQLVEMCALLQDFFKNGQNLLAEAMKEIKPATATAPAAKK